MTRRVNLSRGWTGFALAGLFVLFGAFRPAAGQVTATGTASPRRNVLLIIGDDMGVAQFSRYVDYYNSNISGTLPSITKKLDDDMTGVTPPPTPTIDILADAGVTFMNAWSSPLCSASRAGIYTGLYSVNNGIYGALSSEEEGLDLSTTTIAEVLSHVGYESGLFGKWHLGTHLPDEHGWEWFSGSADGQLDDYYVWDKSVRGCESSGSATSGWTVDCTWEESTTVDDPSSYATFVNVDDALSWINGRSNKWMATVAFNAAHTAGSNPDTASLTNQEPPDDCYNSGSTDDEAQIYKDIISCMDSQIGRLLDPVTGIPASVLANTTIIFVGDNGPEPDYADFDRFGPDGDGKASVYEGGVAVPLIIADGYAYVHRFQTGYGTGRVVSPGRRSFALVQTVDLFKTIADIAGASAYVSSDSDSVSLLPILENTPSGARTYSFTQGELNDDGDGSVAVRSSSYKLLYLVDSGPNGHTISTSCEFYNLSTDRWENSPITGALSLSASVAKSALLTKMNDIAGVTCP